MARVLTPTSGPQDWQALLADPEKHWRTGYSARALAYCWEEASGFPESVQILLSASPLFSDIELLLAIPEHQVPLPGGRRPSQNDLWVLARCEQGLVSIAVEGKVSEPFGPTVGEWLQDASPGKRERIRFLCETLRIDNPPPDDVRYQLLHRTASALIEAKRFCASHAIMLVHSFSQTDEWFDDFARFASLFGAEAEKGSLILSESHSRPTLYLGWVRGEERYLRA